MHNIDGALMMDGEISAAAHVSLSVFCSVLVLWPGGDADNDDYDDEQDDEENAEAEQCHVLWWKRQELVVVRPRRYRY